MNDPLPASFVLEGLWWLLCLAAFFAVVGLELARRLRSRQAPTLQQTADAAASRARRTVEERELAKIEADARAAGEDIWRPDPARTTADR